MQIDNTLAGIIVEVQKAVKEKFNKDITFEQVNDMVDIQMSATVYGFSRNIPIYWKGFLKFLWTDRKQRTKDKHELFAPILDENNNLTDAEREYYHYLARVVSHTKYKELERMSLTSKALTAKEVIDSPTANTKLFNFKVLAKRQKK